MINHGLEPGGATLGVGCNQDIIRSGWEGLDNRVTFRWTEWGYTQTSVDGVWIESVGGVGKIAIVHVIHDK